MLMMPGTYSGGSVINAQVWELTSDGFSRVAHFTSDIIPGIDHYGAPGAYMLGAVEWDPSDNTFKVILPNETNGLVRRRAGFIDGSWKWDNPPWRGVPLVITLDGTDYDTKGWYNLAYAPGVTDVLLIETTYGTEPGVRGNAILGYYGDGPWQVVCDSPPQHYQQVNYPLRVRGSTDQFVIARTAGFPFLFTDSSLTPRVSGRTILRWNSIYGYQNQIYVTHGTDGYNYYYIPLADPGNTSHIWGREKDGVFTEQVAAQPGYPSHGNNLSGAFFPSYPSSADGKNMLALLWDTYNPETGAEDIPPKIAEWNFATQTQVGIIDFVGNPGYDEWPDRIEALSPINAVLAFNRNGTLILQRIGPAPVTPPTISGRLFSWGFNEGGKLGDGTTTERHAPVQIGDDLWTAIAAGFFHTIAIKTDGTLWSWGAQYGGELGLGIDDEGVPHPTPAQIGTDATWKTVSAAYHTLAIKADGSLWAWGGNGSGILGDGTTTSRNAPIQIGSDTWIKASAGDDDSFGIKTDGTLWAWGWGYPGGLGQGDSTATALSPIQVGSDTWIDVAAGGGHCLAIKTDGTLWAWGTNSSGQLGDGTRTDRRTPVQIGSDTWSIVTAGQDQSKGIKTDGTLWSWGHGPVGDGIDESGPGGTWWRSTPVQIGTDAWAAVEAGDTHTLAIKTNGTLWAWGSTWAGQTGVDTDVDPQLAPVQVGTDTTWVAVSAGTYGSSFGLREITAVVTDVTISATPAIGRPPLATTVAILTGAEDPASTFTYDFGDGTTTGPTTDHAQSHTYPRRGNYQVRVTRTSDFNQGACTVTAQGIIKVTAVPNAGLVPLNSIITVTDAEGIS